MADLNSLVEQAAQACFRSRRGVALTGAGISIESGIPPFRGKGGLWEKIDPMKYAHIDALESNPAEVWQVLFLGIADLLTKAEPNEGHKGLRQLEQMGIVQTIITQNVDGLHQAAGSSDVIEFHGTHAKLRCMSCDQRYSWEAVSLETVPPKCGCSGTLRPDVIMFGEMIDMGLLHRSQKLSATCDLMLVIGTSATVEPASYLPVIARHGGAFVIEINPEPTPLTNRISNLSLLGPAGDIMQQIVGKVSELQKSS